jgi:hypothetical protein
MTTRGPGCSRTSSGRGGPQSTPLDTVSTVPDRVSAGSAPVAGATEAVPALLVVVLDANAAAGEIWACGNGAGEIWASGVGAGETGSDETGRIGVSSTVIGPGPAWGAVGSRRRSSRFGTEARPDDPAWGALGRKAVAGGVLAGAEPTTG